MCFSWPHFQKLCSDWLKIMKGNFFFLCLSCANIARREALCKSVACWCKQITEEKPGPRNKAAQLLCFHRERITPLTQGFGSFCNKEKRKRNPKGEMWPLMWHLIGQNANCQQWWENTGSILLQNAIWMNTKGFLILNKGSYSKVIHPNG